MPPPLRCLENKGSVYPGRLQEASVNVNKRCVQEVEWGKSPGCRGEMRHALERSTMDRRPLRNYRREQVVDWEGTKAVRWVGWETPVGKKGRAGSLRRSETNSGKNSSWGQGGGEGPKCSFLDRSVRKTHKKKKMNW